MTYNLIPGRFYRLTLDSVLMKNKRWGLDEMGAFPGYPGQDEVAPSTPTLTLRSGWGNRGGKGLSDSVHVYVIKTIPPNGPHRARCGWVVLVLDNSHVVRLPESELPSKKIHCKNITKFWEKRLGDDPLAKIVLRP